MEEDLAWRQEELAFFKNQLNYVQEENKNKYRKILVLMLYSHFEGFLKLAMQSYIQFINELHISGNSVNSNLLVSNLHREFTAYDNLDRKCKIFERPLPEGDYLHRIYRRVDFVESIDGFKEKIVNIDDDVIDTESNLWYVVLQKNLYRIGLPIEMFADYKSDIDALVNRRNSIAHGNFRSGVSENECLKWEIKVNGLMSDVTRMLYDYVINEKYVKDR
jgi:hypothetical protein